MEKLESYNRSFIDGIANRYFAVLNPVKIELELPFKEIEIPLHPNKKEKRKVKVGKEIFIEKEDFEKYFGKRVGLIYIGEIFLDYKSKFISSELKYDIQKIHWVPSKNLKIKVLFPSGETKELLGERVLKNLKKGEIIQFMRIGFCRLVDKGKMVFYFTHK